jgi:hypothetical protein
MILDRTRTTERFGTHAKTAQTLNWAVLAPTTFAGTTKGVIPPNIKVCVRQIAPGGLNRRCGAFRLAMTT